MIVDASVVIPWFVETEFTKHAIIFREMPFLQAPSFLLIETAHVLFKCARRGEIKPNILQGAPNKLRSVISVLHPYEPLLDNAINVALQTKHSVYDCLYLALALQTRDALVTADKRLAVVATSLAIDTHLIQPEAHP